MDEAGRPLQTPVDNSPGWIIDGRLEIINPLISIEPAALEEARQVLRLWSWTRGSILVRGMAPGSYGPLPEAGGIGDQSAVLIDAFELLRRWDIEDATLD